MLLFTRKTLIAFSDSVDSLYDYVVVLVRSYLRPQMQCSCL